MTQKDADAIEKAITTAVASAIGAAIVAPGHPAGRKEGPAKEWTNDDIRRRVREALSAAVEK
jgi:hypothetical protein